MDTTAMTITTNSEPWREAIRITLAHHAKGTPDAGAAAEATISKWNEMAALLTPVIGTQGVDVVFRRSLYLTSRSFPWLASSEEHEDHSALLTSLKARLAGRDVDDAAEAGCTLLETFIELLTTLIGESLTERMLSAVWAYPSPSSEQEVAS